jgi:parvulin-like peptidyl-prolyl isomerase
MDNAKENSYVARVNGEPIAVGQFRQAGLSNRANVLDYFTSKYGVDGSGDFWNTKFEEEVPMSYLKDRTLKGLIRGKIIQILAKEQELINDISYSNFLKELKEENNRRKGAADRGEVIYGPVQYSEHDYEVYVLNNLELKLEEALANTALPESEENLIEFYEMKKDELYKKVNSIKVMMIYVPYSSEKADLSKEEAKAKIEEVKERLAKGEKFEALVQGYNDKEFNGERIFNEETKRNDMKYDATLRLAAEKLNEGQISDVIDFRSNGTHDSGYCIIKSIENKNEGYRPFSEIKGELKTAYAQMKFQAYIDTMVHEANVEVNSAIYDWVKIE